MAVKNVIEEIERDVIDVTKTDFVHIETNSVPNRHDVELTYESGKEKKGKKINTCVLFVDIRNSVALTEKHHNKTMGRIYTAFTKAVLKVARHHNGHIRNIIGDRVMIVFPTENCYTNAVHCAISINHTAQKVINKIFTGVDFKCGIGIDYGELRVIKVGIQRNGTENLENKGLVWVGYPANYASRLTDYANKIIEEEVYDLKYEPINPKIFPIISWPFMDRISKESDYFPEKTVTLTPSEFANMISFNDTGLSLSTGKIISFKKRIIKKTFQAILMSENVFNNYSKQNPNAKDIKEGFWKVQEHKIKNIDYTIYGGSIKWNLT
jgi:adenylate cyclase